LVNLPARNDLKIEIRAVQPFPSLHLQKRPLTNLR